MINICHIIGFSIVIIFIINYIENYSPVKKDGIILPNYVTDLYGKIKIMILYQLKKYSVLSNM